MKSLLIFGLLITLTLAQSSRPHIITILADDLGVSNIGYSAKLIQQKYVSRGTPYFEAQYANFTPNIDKLANEGITFTRHYAYSSCTSSRMSFLSGRKPTHVGVRLGAPEWWDGGIDPVNGYDGLSPNMTTIAAKLKAAGYTTHHIGKADGLGGATPAHTPTGRGFDTSLAYFSHANDEYDYSAGPLSTGSPVLCTGVYSGGNYLQDFWYNNNTGKVSPYYNCTTKVGGTPSCAYEDDVFTNRAVDIIDGHNRDQPLFLLFSPHLPHTPLQAPVSYIQKVQQLCGNSSSPYPNQCTLPERQNYLAMVMYLDTLVARIISALKRRGMYENALILMVSDNGGPTGVFTGGNTFPLRGGKGSDFEGGLRVPAFISGGYIPTAKRGTQFSKVVHLMDWYTTFCSIAGNSICTGVGADPPADFLGLRPVDGVNIWPYVTGTNSGLPHSYLHLSLGALIATFNNITYKLVTGYIGYDIHTSPDYPNCTYALPSFGLTCEPYCCSAPGIRPNQPSPLLPPPLLYNCGQGCLFNLDTDEVEFNDLCAQNPQICNTMIGTLVRLNQTNFEPFQGCSFKQTVCPIYNSQWNNTYGPFINVPRCPTCIYTTSQYLQQPTFPQTTNDCQCENSETGCKENFYCAWNKVTQVCDVKRKYSQLTIPQLLAIQRFSNGTIDDGDDNEDQGDF